MKGKVMKRANTMPNLDVPIIKSDYNAPGKPRLERKVTQIAFKPNISIKVKDNATKPHYRELKDTNLNEIKEEVDSNSESKSHTGTGVSETARSKVQTSGNVLNANDNEVRKVVVYGDQKKGPKQKHRPVQPQVDALTGAREYFKILELRCILINL